MSWFEALTLAILQGLTEFLPVSSSGHLAVAGALFRSLGDVEARPDGLFFAVMLHVGTLAAIVLYYRRVAWSGARGLLDGGSVNEGPSRSTVDSLRTAYGRRHLTGSCRGTHAEGHG